MSNETDSHPAWVRLQDQLNWYDQKSTHYQKWYKCLKFFQITLAISIPILSHLEPTLAKWLTSIAGGSIALAEAIQHMNQYSTLWVTYRSTAEHLKHEKFLFLSGAGIYKNLDDQEKYTLLAERVEERVSSEHANWFNETKSMLSRKEKKS